MEGLNRVSPDLCDIFPTHMGVGSSVWGEAKNVALFLCGGRAGGGKRGSNSSFSGKGETGYGV